MTNSPKKSLTTKVLIGMLLGIATGFLLQYTQSRTGGEFHVFGISIVLKSLFTDGLFHVIGQIFIASLQMLVVPLVLVSLICGVCSLSEPAQLGRLGGKSLFLYLATTAIAISVAITLALIVSPGTGIEMMSDTQFQPTSAPSLAQTFINMVPSNPISAMATGNMLQIIVFAVLFGVALAMSGESGERLVSFFNDVNVVIMKLVTILMNLAPYGVFALMARLFSDIGLDTIYALLKYFMVTLGALLIHALIIYRLLFVALTRLNPKQLFRKVKDAAVFAFSTASSAATLPVTLETVRYKLGVDNSIASFTAPLGSTINMDGTAIMQGVATVFIAQVFGVDLSIGDYLMVIVTATLASIGTAAVPGVGLVMLALVLQQVNLPVEGIALIIGVDRLLDMTRTAVNVTGDCTVSCIVAHSEGKLDKAIYRDPNAGLAQEQVNLKDFHRQ